MLPLYCKSFIQFSQRRVVIIIIIIIIIHSAHFLYLHRTDRHTTKHIQEDGQDTGKLLFLRTRHPTAGMILSVQYSQSTHW